MTITGRPRPLPECRRCNAPMPRRVWATRRVCSDCATPAERMAAAMTAADLRRTQEATTARVNARIDELAAKRAARATRAP